MSKSNYQLWKEYNPVYFKIQRNPALRHALRKDPGVKFMQRGWTIVFIIILFLSILGYTIK